MAAFSRRGPMAAATSLTGTEDGNSLKLPSGRMALSIGAEKLRGLPLRPRRYKGRFTGRRSALKYNADGQSAECGTRNAEWRRQASEHFIPHFAIRTPHWFLPCLIYRHQLRLVGSR